MQTTSSLSFTEAPGVSLRRAASGRITLTVAATLFVAACAHLSVPLPFTLVPLTLQPFAVLLVGMVLGPALGFAALALYLVEGALGLPVFTPHGLGGVAQLLGPTGGFLLSYPLAAAVAGALARRSATGAVPFSRALFFFVSAAVVIYTCGASWFAHWHQAGVQSAFALAVAPFIPGEVVKVLAAAGIVSALTRSSATSSKGSQPS